MHVVQGFMGDVELHIGKLAVQKVHIAPGDDLLGNVVAQRVGDLGNPALDGGGEVAQDAAGSHLGA